MANRVLIVMDDPAARAALAGVLGGGERIIDSTTAAGAPERAARAEPAVILIDDACLVRDAELGERLRAASPRATLAVLADPSALDAALDAVRRGADEFVSRAAPPEELRARVTLWGDRAPRTGAPAPPDAREPGGAAPAGAAPPAGAAGRSGPAPAPARSARSGALDAILGESAAMESLRRAIVRVAASDAGCVLILGETGSGKELCARAIHELSARRGGPFLAANCTAIPGSLAESELFGHERGAFTGAERRHPGLFAAAEGGTLLLDEVGDLDPAVQAKLLRVLDERAVRRVGGVRPIPVDVRVIAATNRDLERMVASGQFRADLFYRLSQVRIAVPPLRERGDDAVLLARRFAERFAAQTGKPRPDLSAGLTEVVRRHPFPGNVRELRNLIEQCVMRATGPVLALPAAGHVTAMLPVVSAPPSRAPAAAAPGAGPGDGADPGPLADLRRRLLLRERSDVLAALDRAGGNQTRAAEILGISRYALRRRLQRIEQEERS